MGSEGGSVLRAGRTNKEKRHARCARRAHANVCLPFFACAHLVEGLEDDARKLRRLLAGGAGGGGQAAGAERGRANGAVFREGGGKGGGGVSDRSIRHSCRQALERCGALRHLVDSKRIHPWDCSRARARHATGEAGGRPAPPSLCFLFRQGRRHGASAGERSPRPGSTSRRMRPAARPCDARGDDKLTRRGATSRGTRRGSAGGPSRPSSLFFGFCRASSARRERQICRREREREVDVEAMDV